MAYIIDQANAVAAMLEKFTTAHAYQVAGQFANLEFWLGETTHALDALERYAERYACCYQCCIVNSARKELCSVAFLFRLFLRCQAVRQQSSEDLDEAFFESNADSGTGFCQA